MLQPTHSLDDSQAKRNVNIAVDYGRVLCGRTERDRIVAHGRLWASQVLPEPRFVFVVEKTRMLQWAKSAGCGQHEVKKANCGLPMHFGNETEPTSTEQDTSRRLT